MSSGLNRGRSQLNTDITGILFEEGAADTLGGFGLPTQQVNEALNVQQVDYAVPINVGGRVKSCSA